MHKINMIVVSFSALIISYTNIGHATSSDTLDRDQANPVIMKKFQDDMASAMELTSTSILNSDGCALVKEPISKETTKWLYDISFLYWHGNVDREQFIYLGQYEKPNCINYFKLLSNKLTQKEN